MSIEQENNITRNLETKHPKILMKLCYSIAAAIILLILTITIIIAQLFLKFIE